jgi:hypothetical protein
MWDGVALRRRNPSRRQGSRKRSEVPWYVGLSRKSFALNRCELQKA